MRSNVKKLVVLLLSIFLLSSGGFSLKASASGVPVNFKLLERPHVERKAERVTSLRLKDSAGSLKEDDQVRLIVELKGMPLISHAGRKGVKVNDLDRATRLDVKKGLLAEQKAFRELLRGKGVTVRELASYTNVLNGLGVETTFREAKIIEAMPEVANVSIAHEFNRPEPDMASSKEIVNAMAAWTHTGYQGEGMVVAIIDTGMDPSHKDFNLTDASRMKITSGAYTDLPGTYRTAKVPYGYNYMDNNQEILDLGPEATEHGMHVAGTVGANGDEKNGGIRGVAPEAQLLAMKVFGNNPALPTTFGDVIVKAMDDAVELGADVINLSLGAPASFIEADDLEQVAVRRAMENGVICAISAGNAGLFGSGFDDPFASNPDVGVVGSPGIATESLQVASIENTHVSAVALEYPHQGAVGYAPYLQAGTHDPITLLRGPLAYVHVGIGATEDYAGKNLAGKVALVERGVLDFATKILNAQSAGASGVIIYNHAAGGEDLVSMVYPAGGRIPAVFIANSHGKRMVAAMDPGPGLVSFRGNTATARNPQAGKMSDFTSWGTTPNLDFKPEITAPGGNIWSTAQNDGYRTMSGTSMATPHVAGGSALILQRVAEEFGLTGAAKVTMVKNLLMSTAVPHRDKGLYNVHYGLDAHNFTSPRRQGAGVMDLLAAARTPAVAYDRNTGESKVSLGEMGNLSRFTLTLENFSAEEITYRVKGTVQTDLSDGAYNLVETQGVYIDGTVSRQGPNGAWSGEFPIRFSENQVTVPASGKVQIDVDIDLTRAVEWWDNVPLQEMFPNGTFIEGFVTLEDTRDVHPALSIPYMGFYGDWDKAPVIDASIYDAGRASFYGMTALASYEETRGTLDFLGVDHNARADRERIFFSPDRNGRRDNVLPVLSFLRNADVFEASILDAQGKEIRKLHMEENIRKNYYDRGSVSPFRARLDWMWDGTAGNRPVPEGQYYYQVRTKVDHPGAAWQVDTFPVKVDNTRPVIKSVTYDRETNRLTVSAADAYSGVSSYEVRDGLSTLLTSRDGVFNLTGSGVSVRAVLIVVDAAGNTDDYPLAEALRGDNNTVPGGDKSSPGTRTTVYKEPKIAASGDRTAPVVRITSPEFLETYATNALNVQGTIEDPSPVESLRINGAAVPFTWNNKTGRWTFDIPMTYPDGYHAMQVEVRDRAGNAMAFAHKFFVDGTRPVITLQEVPPAETQLEKITLKALFTDNLPSLIVKLDQNMVANIAPDWSYFNDLPKASYLLEKEVTLAMGLNTFVLEGEDEAGNVTRMEVRVVRVAP